MTTKSSSNVMPVVEMTGITVEFPGVKALDGVALRLYPGQVTAPGCTQLTPDP